MAENKRDKIQSTYLVLLMDISIALMSSLLAILYMRWQIHEIPGFEKIVAFWLGISAACSLVSFLLLGTHKIVVRHTSFRSMGRIVFAGVVKEALLAVFVFTDVFQFGSLKSEVFLLVSDFLFTVVLLVLVRVFIIMLYEHLQDDPGNKVDCLNVMVYGTSYKSVSVVTRLEQSVHYNVVGFITRDKSVDGVVLQSKKVYACQTKEDLVQMKRYLGVQCVLFAHDSESDAAREALAEDCLDLGIHILTAPKIDSVDFAGMSQGAIKEVTSGGSEFIPDGMSAFERNLKRALDCFLAGILLIVFSPLFLICYLALKFSDGGPAIYSQERIGRFGRPFMIYKFRSMRVDAEAAGPALYSGDDDPRLTKVGKFLRQHHLDELPQLWNVFIGDMAFIGYRPERKFYIDQIMEIDPRYYYLYQIRPGVTSYATLKNGYTDTMEKMIRRLEFDLYYLRHRSMFFDAKILFQTFMNIVFGKKF